MDDTPPHVADNAIRQDLARETQSPPGSTATASLTGRTARCKPLCVAVSDRSVIMTTDPTAEGDASQAGPVSRRRAPTDPSRRYSKSYTDTSQQPSWRHSTHSADLPLYLEESCSGSGRPGPSHLLTRSRIDRVGPHRILRATIECKWRPSHPATARCAEVLLRRQWASLAVVLHEEDCDRRTTREWVYPGPRSESCCP